MGEPSELQNLAEGNLEELKGIVEKEAYAVPVLLELKDLVCRTLPGQGPPVLHFIPSEGPILGNSSRWGWSEEEKRAVRRIGIFPSSFNPLTFAHAELIRRAQEGFSLEKVLLVLDSQAMDKKVFGASLEDRLLMLRLFARPFPNYQIALSSHGLFLDKLRVLRRLYPSSATSFYFIVGYDTLVRILDPKYYVDREAALGELFRGSDFLVANRAEPPPRDSHDREELAINHHDHAGLVTPADENVLQKDPGIFTGNRHGRQKLAAPVNENRLQRDARNFTAKIPPSIPEDRPCDTPSSGHGELAGGREEIQALLDRHENRLFRDRISFLPLSSFYASNSSTLIRERVAHGEEVAGLVPPAIRFFMEETRLYAPPLVRVRAGQEVKLDLYELRNQLLERLYEVALPQGFRGFQVDLKEQLRITVQELNL